MTPVDVLFLLQVATFALRTEIAAVDSAFVTYRIVALVVHQGEPQAEQAEVVEGVKNCVGLLLLLIFC